MAELNKFIQASDRLVALDSRVTPDIQSFGTLTIFKGRVIQLWEDIESAYQALLQCISSEENPISDSEKASIEDKYTTMFCTYAVLQGRIDDMLAPLQADTSQLAANLTSATGPSVQRSPPPVAPLLVPSVSQPCHRENKSEVSGLPTPVMPPTPEDQNPLLTRLFESTGLPYAHDPYAHRLPLPPCDIETFKGDYSSWPAFRDLFSAVFINNQSLSNIERLFHLLHRTSGDAKNIVSRAPLSHDGFKIAWDQLAARYENKRVLVNSQLKALFSLNPITKETGASLQTLQRGINSCLHKLKIHNISIENWDPILIFHCCQRLPEATFELWEQNLKNKTSIPSWQELDDFLSFRILTLESIQETRACALPTTSRPNASGTPRSAKLLVTQTKGSNSTASADKPRNSTRVCPICANHNHNIYGCPKFRSLSLQERWTKVKTLKLCSNCLGNAHLQQNCTSKFSCSICGIRHHSWLHNPTTTQAKSSPAPTPSSNTPPTQAPQPQSFHQHGSQPRPSLTTQKSILLGTANVLLHHRGLTYPVRALIDSGSEVSCVSKTLRKRLGLATKPANISLLGVNSQVTATSSHLCDFSLSSVYDQSVQFKCSAFVLPRISGNLPTVSIDWIENQPLPALPLADKTFHLSSHVDLLIGADLYSSIMFGGVQHKVLGSLLAQETAFGWILTGPLPHNKDSSPSAFVHFTTTSMNDQLQRFWELEEIPKKRYLSPADKYCEELFRSTTYRNSDGRFVVKLPFKRDYQDGDLLGNSRRTVASIFRRNEASLSKKPEFKLIYDQVLSEYIDLGHMRRVSPPADSEVSNFYLPHHPVLKPESTTTAVRVVFNASHASSNGRSLNDVLHTGPALQADLTILLLKWRLCKFVFSSDITKMYRQILVHPEHTRFQRILFRSNPLDDIGDYIMNTVTFGVNCAPFLAIRTLLHLADDVHRTLPLAAQILRRHMYVDDVLAGYDDIATALKARDEIILALNSAGFQLRKWSANDKQLLAGLPSDHLLT